MLQAIKQTMSFAKTKAIANKGTASIEYILLIAIIVLAVAGALVLLANSMTSSINEASGIIDEAITNAVGE